MISIHAPARGATRQAVGDAVNHANFNPRSREGSDISVIALSHNQTDFNPRSREGSDCKSSCDVLRYRTISIHAPARGATNIAH